MYNKDDIKKALDAAFLTENASFRERGAMASANLSKLGFEGSTINIEDTYFDFVGGHDDEAGMRTWLEIHCSYSPFMVIEKFEIRYGRPVYYITCCNNRDKGRKSKRFFQNYFLQEELAKQFCKFANKLFKYEEFSYERMIDYDHNEHKVVD